MIVNISHSVVGSNLDQGAVKNLAKIIMRARIAGVEEIGV